MNLYAKKRGRGLFNYSTAIFRLSFSAFVDYLLPVLYFLALLHGLCSFSLSQAKRWRHVQVSQCINCILIAADVFLTFQADTCRYEPTGHYGHTSSSLVVTCTCGEDTWTVYHEYTR